MLYGIDDYMSSRRHPLVLLAVAALAVWAVFHLRNPDAPFFSPWSAPAPVSAQSAALSGSFGAVAAGGEGSILGAPTISPAKIDAILASYNSPATGTGQAMYDLGLKYGIDPIYCLAFFIHESTAGTAGVARVTKSVGNIRVTPGYADYQGYRRYDTWEEGIEDWYKLISELYVQGWQLTTVEEIIPVYAPSIENDTQNYINVVNKMVDGWRAEGQ